MRILVTGGTGFLGRHFLARLDRGFVEEARCLVRGAGRGLAATAHGPRITPVPGDLRDAELVPALAGCDAVVHLAAVTGKAAPAELDAVHVEGTRRLLAAAREAGVPRFLHVSTVAVSYPETEHQPYARSKARAELLVKDSGLDWLIVRPTMVFGPGSLAGSRLARLANLPVLPLPGSGTSRVQPVHVADVAALLRRRLADGAFGERVEDVGGRDTVLMVELLRALRRGLRGTEGPSVTLPVAPLISFLGAADPVLRPFLPVTAGQLYVFRYDVVAAEGVDAEQTAARRGVPEIVAEITGVAPETVEAGARRPRASGGSVPAPIDRESLAEECAQFVRYLTGLEASAALRAKYVQAHEPGCRGPVRSVDEEDDELVRIACHGPASARMADTWAAVFDRTGVLRRKLVLVLALLENGPDAERIDRPEPGGYAAFLRAVAWRSLAFLFWLASAFFWVGPRWLLAGRTGRDGEAPR